MPDSDSRSSAIYGTYILPAGATYDTVIDPTLPVVYEFVIMNAGGTVTSLLQEDGQDLDESYANGGKLAKQALAGNIGVNTPITVESGNLLMQIKSGTAIMALYTVRKRNIL